MPHRLSAIDSEARTGTCSFCGPVHLVLREMRANGPSWRCSVQFYAAVKRREADGRYRESKRRSSAAYRKRNPELKAAYNREWNAKNKERKAELYAAWYAKNKDQVLDKNARVRARAGGALIVKGVSRQVVLDRDQGICHICKRKVMGKFDLDHVVPISRGGQHTYSNVKVACPSCNRRKYAKVEQSRAGSESRPTIGSQR